MINGYGVVVDAAPDAGQTTVQIIEYTYERVFRRACHAIRSAHRREQTPLKNRREINNSIALRRPHPGGWDAAVVTVPVVCDNSRSNFADSFVGRT
jgi:hypothetical protein